MPVYNGYGAKIIDDRAIFVCLRGSRSSVTARIVLVSLKQLSRRLSRINGSGITILPSNANFRKPPQAAEPQQRLRPYHSAE